MVLVYCVTFFFMYKIFSKKSNKLIGNARKESATSDELQKYYVYTKDVVRFVVVLIKMKSKRKTKHLVRNPHLGLFKMNLKIMRLHCLIMVSNFKGIKYLNKEKK